MSRYDDGRDKGESLAYEGEQLNKETKKQKEIIKMLNDVTAKVAQIYKGTIEDNRRKD